MGDGPQRQTIESLVASLGREESIYFLGNRSDTPQLLAAMDVFTLTSHNEANPVSILEALSTEVPVVATRVGSVSETVIDGQTGYTVEPGNIEQATQRVLQLLLDTRHGKMLGKQGRELVEKTSSLQSMVRGYEGLITSIYKQKTQF